MQCEFQVFMKQNTTACNTVTLSVSYKVWNQLHDNEWLFALSSPLTAEITSSIQETSSIQLPKIGILTIVNRAHFQAHL
jgi:hypothetical protein